MRIGITKIDREKKEKDFISLIIKDFKNAKPKDYYSKGFKINHRKIFQYKNLNLIAFCHEINISYSIIEMPNLNYLTAAQIKNLPILDT